ncbi:hypothetical protein CRUP_032703 [Coryphaenoides rupestris]|nr:hypothetical protein CRUP_032703 [Coryphaenoides rupestris]
MGRLQTLDRLKWSSTVELVFSNSHCWPGAEGLQVFTLGWRQDIRVGDPVHSKKVCLDAVSHSSLVTLYSCHGMKGNQLWSNSCVDSSPSDHRVFMNTCSPSAPGQQWLFEKTNSTVLDHFNLPAN